MYLAINYSDQAAGLLREGKIHIDRFKCPDWEDMISEASRLCPVAVHLDLKPKRVRLEQTDWSRIEHILEQTNTPYVNLDLVARVKDFPEIPVDATDPGHNERILERLVANLNQAVKYFGAERVIGENVPYHANQGNVLRPAVEPEIIRRALEETGCGLLLDISHARIAAHYLEMDEHEYLRQLPAEKIREMHFTGVHDFEGKWQDHLSAQADDWQALEWVLERVRSGVWPHPWLLAFEYGGVGKKFAWRSDSQVIEEQTARLNMMLKPV